ncbi:MAG: PQQ-like beta-propeller repeat protein [Clostridia bacterium]|nr:PQQ-like beta-propeller repeat protein [Clostridia bacterium]
MEGSVLLAHHKKYSVYSDPEKWTNYYSDGPVASLHYSPADCTVTVLYRSGEKHTWKSKYIDSYNMGQFGIAVSADGTKVFVQTWNMGLFCYNAKTGEQLWRTKSRRGVTNIFVGDRTVTAHVHEYAMHLIDVDTGEVIKEKRPAYAWGFTSLDNRYIVCKATARKWEIIDAETLAVAESFTHREFTDGHTDFCINNITLQPCGIIRVAGFKNVWDNSTYPPKRLPNAVFEYYLKSKYLEGYKSSGADT